MRKVGAAHNVGSIASADRRLSACLSACLPTCLPAFYCTVHRYVQYIGTYSTVQYSK